MIPGSSGTALYSAQLHAVAIDTLHHPTASAILSVFIFLNVFTHHGCNGHNTSHRSLASNESNVFASVIDFALSRLSCGHHPQPSTYLRLDHVLFDIDTDTY